MPLTLLKHPESPKTKHPQVFKSWGKLGDSTPNLGKSKVTGVCQIKNSQIEALQHFLSIKIARQFFKNIRWAKLQKNESLVFFNPVFSASQLSPKFFPSFEKNG